MDRIRQLWSTFSNSEKRYLRIYLEAFHKGTDNTAMRLVQLLEKRPDITQEEASEALYGKKRTQAFSMLKGRLLERMLDVLSLSVNLQNHPLAKEDPVVFAKTQLYKQFLASLLVRKRGLTDLADELAHKVRSQSETLDYPEGLLLSLPIIASRQAARGKPVRAIWEVIDTSIQQFKNDLASLGFFEEYRAVYGGHSGTEVERTEFLENAVTEIQQRLEETYSSRAHFYYLNLLLEKHTQENNTRAMREVLFELLDLLESHEGLNQRNRQVATSIRLAALELHDKRFEEAYEAASRAKAAAPPRRINAVYACLIFGYAAFYTGRLQEARNAIEELDEQLMTEAGERNVGIFAFLKAVIAYAEDDIYAAKAQLWEADPLYQDKHGWNLGLRIFDIMLHIDMRKFDLAEGMIANLRRHVQKYSQPNSREMQMYRFLNVLNRTSYQMDEACKQAADSLERLCDFSDWQPYSHEPIPYGIWIEAKRSGDRPYALLRNKLIENNSQ